MQYIKRSPVTRFFVVPLTLLALFSGCYTWTNPAQSPADFIRVEAPSQVRLTLKDNRQFVVRNPTATDSTISWPEADTLATIRLDQLRFLEARRLDAEKTIGATSGALVVAGILVLIPLWIACSGDDCLDWGG